MADPSSLPPLPKDHLDHPENWATGADPATDKQKGFIKVLEDKNPGLVPSDGLDVVNMGKSEASEVIEKLKNGEEVITGDAEKNGKKVMSGDAEKNGEDVKSREEVKNGDVKEHGKEEAAEITTTEAVEPSGDESQKKEDVALEAPSSLDDDKVDKQTSDKKKAVEGDNKDHSDDKTIAVDPPSEEKLEKGQSTLDSALKPTASSSTNESKRPSDHAENGTGDGGEEDRKSKKARVEDAVDDHVVKTPVSGHRKRSSTVSIPVSEMPIQTPSKTTSHVPPTTAEPSTLPGDGEHLDHPENWTTGDEPATEKQKGFIKVLEKQKGVDAQQKVGDLGDLGKSEASEKIEDLKSM
ncbi:hypothetical protein BCR39DRAFT_540908 [Naematelia encephala]|uniref:Uncharacterized protein n=1 Tax=Naematelia encephala TaxID=71784 RepID=A0A1Y2AVB3_9TREE|nr:hypothetical protein BCR39DRAFT_540908 [Naematelia encephala]